MAVPSGGRLRGEPVGQLVPDQRLSAVVEVRNEQLARCGARSDGLIVFVDELCDAHVAGEGQHWLAWPAASDEPFGGHE
jgi:hypothetical protein